MKKAKKKLLSTSLSLAMAVNLVPMSGLQSVSAESGSANNIPCVDDAESLTMPALKMPTVKTLANNTTIYASTLSNNADLKLTENTTLVIDESITLSSISGNYDLVIQGSDTVNNRKLIIKGLGNGISVSSLTSNNVDLKIISGGHSIFAQGDITINGGYLYLDTYGSGIYSSNGNISIDGGIHEISCGDYYYPIVADNGNITTQNCMLDAKGKMYGITSKKGSISLGGEISAWGVNGINAYDEISITGGSTFVQGFLGLSANKITIDGDLEVAKYGGISGESFPIRATNDVIINSGIINLTCSDKGWAIKSTNGDVVINNGIINAHGAEGGIYSPNGSVTLNGTVEVFGLNTVIAKNSITIAGGKTVVRGINGICADTITIDGSLEAKIQTDYNGSCGIEATNNITINSDGNVDVNAIYGLCSNNGSINIYGGVKVSAYQAILAQNNINIYGGSLEANSSQYVPALRTGTGKINIYSMIISLPENGTKSGDMKTILDLNGYVASSVKIVDNPITGTAKIKGLAKDAGDTLELELTGVPTPIARCTWQRSADQETWYNVESVSDISDYTTKAGDATYYFRAKITSRGYSGEIYSDVRYINKNVLSGGIVYTSSVSCGEIVSTGLTGDLGTLYNSTPNSVHFQWQSSTDGTSSWTNISGATSKSYTPAASDFGKYIRLVVTADKYSGELYSTAQKVSKPSNLNSPVTPELSTTYPYTSIVISNAKADQEYLLSTSVQTPTDWSSAVSPTVNGSLTLDCSRYYRYYVHTRFKETDTHSAGRFSKYGTIYTNTSDYIKGFTFDKTSFDTKVGEVTALTVKPVPEDWSGWDDTYTINWFVNSSNPSNKEVKLYTDADCTQEIDSTAFISNKTIYVKGVAQTRSVTVGVEKQVGQTELLHDYCYVRVADADGNYALDELTFNEATILQGETATLNYETDPIPATVGALTFEKSSAPSDSSELIITDNSDGTVTVAVPADAKIGKYTYIVKVDGNEPTIRSYITVNVVSSTVGVKFFPNGGSGSMNYAMVKKGSEYILPECGYTAPAGKEFAGWEISGTVYDVGDGVIITKATSVTAQWKDHVHSMAHIPAMSATCTMAGNTEYYICDDCGKWYSDADATTEITNHASVVIAATDHTPAAAVKENEVSATCTKDGGYDEVVYCSVCGDEISRTHYTTDATGHSLTLVSAKEPTNTASGNKAYYVCSKCGEWFEDAEGTKLITDHSEYIIAPISNTIIGASITLDGDMGVNFYAALTDDVTKAILSGPKGDVVLEAADLALLKQTTGDNAGTYKLTYPVNATQAGETISLKLYDSTDKQLDIYKSSGAIDDDKTITYSVSEYIETSSNYITDTKLNNLVSALDNYRKAAENEFNDSSNTISGINNVNLESFEPYMFKKTGSETAKIALILNSETSIRITYNGTGVVKYGSKTLTKSADGYYYIKNIPAHELVTGKTLKIGDTTFTNFSALSYGYTVLNGGSTDPDLQKLVKALLKYAEAADAYKNN